MDLSESAPANRDKYLRVFRGAGLIFNEANLQV